MIRQTITFWIKPVNEKKVWIKYTVDHDKELRTIEAEELMEDLMLNELFSQYPYNENFQVYSIEKSKENSVLGWEYAKSPVKKIKNNLIKNVDLIKKDDSKEKIQYTRKFNSTGLINRKGEIFYCSFAEHYKLVQKLHIEGKITTTYKEDKMMSSDEIYDELYGWIDDNGWVKFSMGSFSFGNTGRTGLHDYHLYNYGFTEEQLKTMTYLLVKSGDSEITINALNLKISDFLKIVDEETYNVINHPSITLDKQNVGNKAYNLCLMRKKGLNVPYFVIIPNETCLRILKEKEVSNKIIEKLELPESITYSVRSSAPISMPGMLDSCLFVKKEDLKEKIMYVINSWFNKRAIEYRKLMNISEDCKISVIIQEMVNVTENEKSGSGVFININRKTGKNGLEGEFIEKLPGTFLVGGEVTPKTLDEINPKVLKNIKEQSKLISELTSIAQEVEFAYNANEVYILQMRDYKENKIVKTVSHNGTQIGIGRRGNEGVAIGFAVFDDEDIINIKEDKIFVAHHTYVEDVPRMSKCKGVMSAIGGSLSHAAIASRQLGLPCVAGVGYKLENKKAIFQSGIIIKSGDKICVDGNTGKIYVL